MFSISRPKFCPARYGGGRNQCIAQFDSMAFFVPSQIFSSKAAHSGVDGTPTLFLNGRRHQGGSDFDSLWGALTGAAETARLV